MMGKPGVDLEALVWQGNLLPLSNKLPDFCDLTTNTKYKFMNELGHLMAVELVCGN